MHGEVMRSEGETVQDIVLVQYRSIEELRDEVGVVTDL
jgi:hypothetical protein